MLLGRALVSTRSPSSGRTHQPPRHPCHTLAGRVYTVLQRSYLFVTHAASSCRNNPRILDLDRGTLTNYNCDYTTFLERKRNFSTPRLAALLPLIRNFQEEFGFARESKLGLERRTMRALKQMRREHSKRQDYRVVFKWRSFTLKSQDKKSYCQESPSWLRRKSWWTTSHKTDAG